jgi:hypothetical protein
MILVLLDSIVHLDHQHQLTALQVLTVTIYMVRTYRIVVFALLVLSAHISELRNPFLVDQVNSVLKVRSSSLIAPEVHTIPNLVCMTQENAQLVMLVIIVL